MKTKVIDPENRGHCQEGMKQVLDHETGCEPGDSWGCHAQPVARSLWWKCQQRQQQAGNRVHGSARLIYMCGWRDVKAGGEGQNRSVQPALYTPVCILCSV